MPEERKDARATIAVLLLLLLFAPSCRLWDPEDPGGRIFRETRDVIATYVTITVVAEDEEAAGTAIDAGFAEIQRLAGLLSSWDPESELSRVNREAGQRAVRVSPEVADVARTALTIAELTGGAFDPTVGPLIRVWNVTRAERPPDREEVQRARSRVGYRNVVVDGDRIRFLAPDLEFNLGGIAKGYMADRVVEVLKERGIPGGLVAMAGDIRGFGRRPDGEPWRVGVKDPRGDGLIAEVNLEDAAISTSGDYERFFEFEGRRYHHLLDPSTGYPARGLQGVTVIHPMGVMADGLATGLFVLGPVRGLELMKAEGIGGLIVDDRHRLVVAPGSERFVEPPGDASVPGT